MKDYANNIFGQFYFSTPQLKRVRIHLLVWGIFLVYEVLVVGLATNKFGAFWSYVLHYTLNISLFYIHAHLVMPLLKRKINERYFLLSLGLALEVTLFIFINSISEALLVGNFDWKALNPEYKRNWISLWRSIYFLSFSTAYYYLLQYIAMQELSKRSIIESHRAELKVITVREQLKEVQNAYLKAQINPHFFFNTLTFLHALTLKKEPLAAEGLETLSKIMRYAVNADQTQPFIALGTEIAQLNNLIHLQKLRMQAHFNMVFTYQPMVLEIYFIPLIVLTLAENIFKHGNLSNPLHPARMHISVESNVLIIDTFNLVNTGINTSGQQIGMRNIDSRLAHTYADKATFSYGLNDGWFKTTITLLLV